ncbi:uncharacterized protein EHS24_009122 [Apiotrichum porosum]|uniref:C3H1-type domain-containing protein n=1 Tax=Apiotrichum porosum TaxID=105984 RepID=A0A427XNP4_9TREE|nr:uncharacterized protein EHS24_009122 [Apiotrichum porosum]RSH80541.1 hypothetical protein EHS24_009122 [Apiotrichum porosum]
MAARWFCLGRPILTPCLLHICAPFVDLAITLQTFGMKNKNKSTKVQKYIQEVQKQQSQAGKNKEQLAKQKLAEDRARSKEADAAKKAMEAQLFTPTQQIQKVAFGTDPKTVLCVFFKAGNCTKGNKCKFSHDRNVERKVEKVNIYEDKRAGEEEKKKETMDDWDDAKLNEVVNQNARKQRTTTDIVCKFFVQAIEDRKYGWFWICPNGGDNCMYKHALPPGFVLKKDEKKAVKDEISLEDFVEVERHKLQPPLTPCTPETFAAWKKARLEKKAAEQEALDKAKTLQRAAGKMSGMTGKDMFEFGSELYADEEDDVEEEWDISRMLARYAEEDGERQEDDDAAEDDDDVKTVTDGVAQVAV